MTANPPLGHTTWMFSCGHVPLNSTGHEPEFTSRDELCMLNTGGDDAKVHLTFYFADDDVAGPFPLTVAAERVCHVRINDLIDPHALPLGVPYGLVVTSDEPITAQMVRTDTRRDALALAMITGSPA